MKIVIPTDFSDLSKIALRYAAQFAVHGHHSLLLMNNISTESVPRAGVLINLEDKIEKNAIEDILQLKAWIESEFQPSPDIFHEITKSENSAKAILDTAKSQNAGLIIMGAKGASGITGAILGSVSSEVIRKSEIPVIVVPPEAEFKISGLLVLAVDPLTPPSEQSLKHFINMCKKFGKKPEFFFAGSGDNETAITDFVNLVNGLLADSQGVFHKHPGNDPVVAINDFTSHNPCMMIAVVPSQYSFFERILGKSVTTKIMAHTTIPVLTLP